MRLSYLTFAFLALKTSASLVDDVYSVLDYAGDLLGPGKAQFSAAVADIMKNPLVIRVFDDLNNSNHTTEANEELCDHVHEAMAALFGTADTAELVKQFSDRSSAMFDAPEVNKILVKAHEQIRDNLDWVVPSIVEDKKLQNKTVEFQKAVVVIKEENQQHPMKMDGSGDGGFLNLVSRVSPEALAEVKIDDEPVQEAAPVSSHKSKATSSFSASSSSSVSSSVQRPNSTLSTSTSKSASSSRVTTVHTSAQVSPSPSSASSSASSVQASPSTSQPLANSAFGPTPKLLTAIVTIVFCLSI